jgi:hypothetical protein
MRCKSVFDQNAKTVVEPKLSDESKRGLMLMTLKIAGG